MVPNISIIIPVYNGELFVGNCLKSVINQTMGNLQIIVVNDGSTDGTSEILETYAANDTRIEIIHQQNGGVAKARNIGLSSANGEWILFVDSDDSITEDYCANMLDAANRLDVDILIAYPDTNEEKQVYLLDERKKLILACLSFDEVSFPFNVDAPWGKLFRNSFIQDKHIRFPERLSRSEDALFCASIYESCTKVGAMNQFGYIHNERDGSLCRSYSPNGTKMLEMILFENQKWIMTYHPNEEEYMRALWYRVLPGIVECETSYFLHSDNSQSRTKSAIEYQRFLNQKMIKRAIQQLKIKDVENHQYRIRLCFYKLLLGWFFIIIKGK